MQKWTADIADGPLMEMMADERPLMEMIALKKTADKKMILFIPPTFIYDCICKMSDVTLVAL